MVTYVVTTGQQGRDVSGMDSMIAQLPAPLKEFFAPGRPWPVALLNRVLRQLAQDAADNLGETLHHADWVITGDPTEVERRGMIHDCVSCRAGVDQALTYLRDNPHQQLLVGTLYWAGPPED